MTDRYNAWLNALALRDATLISLAVSGAALALAWCLIDYLPAAMQPRLRTAYLWAGIPLYLFTIYYGFTFGGAK